MTDEGKEPAAAGEIAIEAVAETALQVSLTDDNPTDRDLLGFDAIVAPIRDALRQENLDPITIGVHAPWGGGKSTLLELLQRELRHEAIVIRTNPWEYDDQFDVKGTLIGEVLNRLKEEVEFDEGMTEKFTKLVKRVSWSRVGIAVAKGVLTTQWDPEALVNAFSPTNDDGPRSLAAFRDEFSELLDALKVKRVVVLVDDLDRCLPPAVLSTLEAIKLFLSVKRMAFVIAADQDMIRDAIAANLAATNRSEVFASRYLEKIVQLPVVLPRLSQAETEAYIVLLLAEGSPDHNELLQQVKERRARNEVPLVTGEGINDAKIGQVITLAAQIAEGLSPSKRGNPREVKRFLNSFGIRSSIARVRGVSLAPSVVVKLLFLEEQHRSEFEHLVGLAPAERKEFIAAWEGWAREGKELPTINGKPVAEETKEWVAADPRLVDEDLDRYISLAASLAAASLSSGLTDELRELVRELTSDSEANRGEALERVAKKPIEEQRSVATALLAESRRATSVDILAESLIGLGKAVPALVDDIAFGFQTHMWTKLDESAAYRLATSEVPQFGDLAKKLAGDGAIDAGVREAAKEALGG